MRAADPRAPWRRFARAWAAAAILALLAAVTGLVALSPLLVWFGDTVAATAPGTALWLVLLAGGVTLLPLCVAPLRRRRQPAAGPDGPPRDRNGPAA